MAVNFKTALVAFAVLGIAALLATPAAQPFGPGAGFLGRGMMMGPWWMGRHGYGGICIRAATGLAEWRIDRIAQVIKPTDEQRSKFEDFKAASVKSAEAMREACLTDVPDTILGRTEVMERRLDTMLQAVHTIRPTLEAFYATLSDEQKKQLDSILAPSRFWHWRDRW